MLANFAFWILPTVVFVSALSSLLYYFGILQFVVKKMAWVMNRFLGISGSESVAAAANVFVGQTEAPLLVKPYLDRMTRSEMLCLMVGGMATIAGGVLGAVVGILGQTGTPSDKVIWIPIMGIQNMEGHSAEHSNSVSAVLLNLRGAAGFALEMKYNKQGDVATFAWPIPAILADFFDRLTWFEKILQWIAYLIGLMSTLIILSVLRSSLNERKREFAIIRCLGASRSFVTCVVLGQSLIISAVGALGSLLIYFLTSSIATLFIRENTGVMIEPFQWDMIFIHVIYGTLLLGLISGVIPAISAYRVEISKSLQQNS